MSRLTITLALLLSLASGAAARTIEELERPLELTLGSVRLPTGEAGTLTFQQCAECSYNTHRTTETTEFQINGRALPLADFLLAVEEIRARPGTPETDTIVTVFLDLATERVTRVTVRF